MNVIILRIQQNSATVYEIGSITKKKHPEEFFSLNDMFLFEFYEFFEF